MPPPAPLPAAPPPAALSLRHEWRRGGPVVLAAHIGMATGAGLYLYVSSLFVTPFSEAFGWSRGDLSIGVALGLTGSLSAPVIGNLADRFGARAVAATCFTALALIFIGLSQMTGAFWQFVLLSGLLGVVAPGCTSLVFSRAVAGWFVKGRGQALGVTAAGMSVGALVFTPLVAGMIARYGYQGGLFTLAALALGLGLPAIFLGVREIPRGPVDLQDDAVKQAAGLAPDRPAQSIWRVLASRKFLALALAVLATNIPGAGVITQLEPLLAHNGVAFPALLISLFAVAVLIGRVGIGWLFDRTDARRVAAVFTIVGGLGCVMLMSGSPAWLVIPAVVMVGLLQGMETDVIGYFVAKQFDRDQFGLLYGLLLTVSMVGTAAGVVGFGVLYDRAQSYDLALVLAAGTLAVALYGYLRIPAGKADPLVPSHP